MSSQHRDDKGQEFRIAHTHEALLLASFFVGPSAVNEHAVAASVQTFSLKCSLQVLRDDTEVDADEKFNGNLLTYLHDIVDNNKNIDVFLIPRVNVVSGLTDDDIRRWGWRINEKGWVMFPDYQTRLYRNAEYIKWEGKVHERIVGYQTHAPLPAEEEWSLYHIKDIERQRKQNDYYDTITR